MNSTYGLAGGDGSAAYCVSKGGIATLTKSRRSMRQAGHEDPGQRRLPRARS